jgi:hypothetical protein
MPRRHGHDGHEQQAQAVASSSALIIAAWLAWSVRWAWWYEWSITSPRDRELLVATSAESKTEVSKPAKNCQRKESPMSAQNHSDAVVERSC